MQEKMTRRLLALALAFGAAPAAAEVFPVSTGTATEKNPVVVATETPDRFVVGWVGGSSVSASVLTGTTATGGVNLFRGNVATGTSFLDPALAFKTGQDRVFGAAVRLDGGPIVAYAIELAVFDRDLRVLHRRWINAPGGHVEEGYPSLAADDVEADDCCVLLAYENPNTRSLELEQLGPTGARYGAPIALPTPLSGRLSNPKVVYQRDRDQFLIVYETHRDIRARVLTATTAAPGPEVLLATKVVRGPIGSRGSSRPVVAYARARDTYFVSWTDNGEVYGLFLNGDGASFTDPFPVRGGARCGGLPLFCEFAPVPYGPPTLLAADGGDSFRLVVEGRNRFTPSEGSTLVAFTVWPPDTDGPYAWERLITATEGPSAQPAAALDPRSGNAVAAFQRLGDLWAVTFVP